MISPDKESSMKNLFKKRDAVDRETYEKRYKHARENLLLVVVLTAVNFGLVLSGSDRYFPFSAFLPYYLTMLGMLLCGRFGEEVYVGELKDIVFLNDSFFYIMVSVAIVIALLYLLACFMSRNGRVGWLIFALAFFSIDLLSLFYVYGISFEITADVVFHVLVIIVLSFGIHAHYKLKSLPPEPEASDLPDLLDEDGDLADEDIEYAFVDGEDEESTEGTPALRLADKDIKHRVLLEVSIPKYDITYRRVKRTNELVINGKIYDEYVALMEFDHRLCATVDGHRITAGFEDFKSYITFDGEILKKKRRLW